MNTNARIIASCFITSLLLAAASAFADDFRPSMSERDEPTPLPAPVAEPETPVETTVTTGDALEVQPGETLPVRMLDFPRRGMSMDKVQNELGRPVQIIPAVGEPPITTWVYDDRNVYFENSTVIHVVATR